MEYKWKSGARAKVKAQVAGEELERIRIRDGEELSPEAVVTEARKKKSPLHDEFEWDDTVAAHEFRLEQARCMIRSVLVTREGGKEIRAFLNVRVEAADEDAPAKVYTSIERAMSDPVFRAQVLAKARKELQEWRKRYNDLEEFASIYRAMDEEAA